MDKDEAIDNLFKAIEEYVGEVHKNTYSGYMYGPEQRLKDAILDFRKEILKTVEDALNETIDAINASKSP